VALGTMQFGGNMNLGYFGQEDSMRMVKRAIDISWVGAMSMIEIPVYVY